MKGQIWQTTLKALYVKKSAAGTCSFRVHTGFDAEANVEYGAASVGWTSIDVGSTDGSIDVEIGMFNKTTTRLPEAMFVQFQTVSTSMCVQRACVRACVRGHVHIEWGLFVCVCVCLRAQCGFGHGRMQLPIRVRTWDASPIYH